MCGRFASPQRGHELALGAFNFQFAAWRMRPLDLDFFFFGTAIARSSFGDVFGAI